LSALTHIWRLTLVSGYQLPQPVVDNMTRKRVVSTYLGQPQCFGIISVAPWSRDRAPAIPSQAYAQIPDSRRPLYGAIGSRRRPSIDHTQRPALCTARWTTGPGVTASRGPSALADSYLTAVAYFARGRVQSIARWTAHATHCSGRQHSRARGWRASCVGVRSALSSSWCL